MAQIATHPGLVTDVKQGKVIVKMQVLSACSSCAGHEKCAFVDKTDKVVEVETADWKQYSIGDGVTVSVNEGLGLYAVLLAYILPALIIVGAVIAISAATQDPRFSPIRPEELPMLEISVDVLGEPEDIDSEDELDVRRYGVIVSSGRKRGLLLPDLDGVDTVSQQVDIAMRKGGIHRFEKYRLQRFEVIRHH